MKMYRYIARAHRQWVDECRTELTGVSIELQVFHVRRTTRCGVWIYDDITYCERWVSTRARKAFAYQTKEEALNSFRIRNARRIMYLKRDLKEAELARKALDTPDLHIDIIDLLTGAPK